MVAMHAFERELRVATRGLEPAQIAPLLAQAARQALADAQAAGEFPREYVTSVNGRIGASEDQVVPPGPIVYSGNWWQEIISYGIEFARQRSPVKSGRYKNSWFVMINGGERRGDDYSNVALDAEVIITNDQPYSRKIEVGAIHVSVPPAIVEDTASALKRRFGDLITAERRFINLQGAYQLRQSTGRRRSRQRGRVVTYPAVVVGMRA
jgi:hypothetical protein